MTTYTILVSRDGGETWKVHPASPIEAANGDAAVGKLRAADAELAADLDAQFLPLAKFEPRQMEKQLVEKWSLGKVSERPENEGGEQTQIGGTA